MVLRRLIVALLALASTACTLADSVSAVNLSKLELERISQSSPKVRELLSVAESTIGTPYKWGGANLRKGIDCSNFTWQICRAVGLPYSRFYSTMVMSRIKTSDSLKSVPFSEAKTGDLLVYGYREKDNENRWRGHVVMLMDKSGSATGHPGLVLGAHGGEIRGVQFVTFDGFETGFFGRPEMKLVNVLRVRGMYGTPESPR